MSEAKEEEKDSVLYFVKDKSERVGPFTLRELYRKWQEGEISSEATYIGKELDQEWFDGMFNKELMAPNTKRGVDESVLLLRQIEENTAKTHLWVRVCGIPVLLGFFFWLIRLIASIK